MVAVVCSQCNWHAKDKTPLPNSCPISCAALCSMTCRIRRRRNPRQLEAFINTLSLFESSQSYQHLKQLAKSSTVHFFFYPFWAFPVHSCILSFSLSASLLLILCIISSSLGMQWTNYLVWRFKDFEKVFLVILEKRSQTGKIRE